VWNSTNVNDESLLFWQHVRLAGLAPGPTDITSPNLLPTNAAGGTIGITNAQLSPVTGLSGSFIICSNAITGKFAKQLDIQMDGGDTATGTMRVVPAGTVTPTAAIALTAIDDNSTYLVCTGY
jgi:hypothetical protein